jgi:hypothetical protein
MAENEERRCVRVNPPPALLLHATIQTKLAADTGYDVMIASRELQLHVATLLIHGVFVLFTLFSFMIQYEFGCYLDPIVRAYH